MADEEELRKELETLRIQRRQTESKLRMLEHKENQFKAGEARRGGPIKRGRDFGPEGERGKLPRLERNFGDRERPRFLSAVVVAGENGRRAERGEREERDREKAKVDRETEKNEDSELSRKGDTEEEDKTKNEEEKEEGETEDFRSNLPKHSLGSAVVEKNPHNVGSESEQVKQRNRRMFGSLLLGTLQQFKKDLKSKSSIEEKRKELEKKVEEKVAKEHENIVESHKKHIMEQKEEEAAKHAQLKEKIIELEIKLKTTIKEKRRKLLSNFIRTNTEPCVYWHPADKEGVDKKLVATLLQQSNERAAAAEALAEEKAKKNMSVAEHSDNENESGNKKENGTKEEGKAQKEDTDDQQGDKDIEDRKDEDIDDVSEEVRQMLE